MAATYNILDPCIGMTANYNSALSWVQNYTKNRRSPQYGSLLEFFYHDIETWLNLIPSLTEKNLLVEVLTNESVGSFKAWHGPIDYGAC